jgi:hypothetical protein
MPSAERCSTGRFAAGEPLRVPGISFACHHSR